MFEGKEVKILLANAGCGKGNWTGCMIPTPEGIRKFGDLKEGDYVFNRTGKPVKILRVYHRGLLDAYRVTLSDGRSTVVSLDHLWNVSKGLKGRIKTMELGEILEAGLRYSDKRPNHIYRNPKFYIPCHQARKYAKREVIMYPYVYGAFIGNGCLTEKYLTLSSADEETVSKVAQLMHFTYKKRSKNNFSWDFKANNKPVLTSTYFEKLYSKDKYIPDCYKYNCEEVRCELLQGLFDTDGNAYMNGKRLSVSYSTTSERLARDVQEVLNSLGMVSSIRIDKRYDNYCYIVNVNATVENKKKLFSLKRKLEICNKAKENRRHYDKVAIRSVEKLPEKLEINCIWVDDEEHLYQCDDGIVTHNTSRLVKAIEEDLLYRRPEELAFVTFTRKGAEEGLRRICNKLRYSPEDLPYFRTIHSLTFHALNYKGDQMFNRIDQRKFNKEYGYNLNQSETGTGEVLMTKDTRYLEFYGLERSGSLTTRQLMEADIDRAYYDRLVKSYNEYKKRENKIDFFDCLIHFAMYGQPLPVKVLYLDESQDLTTLQWKVVEKAFSNAEKIVIAGDMKQAIYSYSGARPDIFIDLSNKYPVEYLAKSYRVPKKVLDLSIAITNLMQNKTKQKVEHRKENGEGNIIQLNDISRIVNFIDETNLKDNPDSTEWYILARNNCFLEYPERILEEALIPYWTSEGFFMGGAIMQRLKDYHNFRKQGYKDERKRESFRRKFGIEDFSQPFTDTNLFTEGRKWVYASYIEKYGLETLEKMCSWNPQILVSTIHHVKGGECSNCVLLLDCTRKTVANIYDDLDDELRVLYVGVTRAKENLFLVDSKHGNGYDSLFMNLKNEYGFEW